MKHLLSLESMPVADMEVILQSATAFKRERGQDARKPLAGQTWALIFSKSSTRTRVSFEVGIRELGGNVMFLNANDIQLGRGEPIKDTARVLGRMIHGAVIRTFAQSDVDQFAQFSGIPTINALTDDEHPCQILTDIFTYQERRGSIKGKVVTFVGDGACNVPISWIFAAAKLGFELRIAAPRAFQPEDTLLQRAGGKGQTVFGGDRRFEFPSGGRIVCTENLQAAATGSDLLYTDVWVSMGKEAEAADRIKVLTGYQINAGLVKAAHPDALVMHCLPAYRGKEIDAETFEAHADTIFNQAENRLHVQKAILNWIVTPEPAKKRVLDAPATNAKVATDMSTHAPAAPQKINLRRPDVMEAVQAQVISHYRSNLVNRIRESGGMLSAPGKLTIKLAKEFGFCYGVERAIDLAYAARKVFPSPKSIFLLGEIIHNPEVNDQIRNMGIQSISPKPTDEEISRLRAEDVVIIPAFGTEVETRKQIEAKGCAIVDTTCGDVMSVWKRVRQYSKETVTSIIHGKAKHEETKATTSQATAYGTGHYLVVFTLEETDYVCDYLLNGGNKQEFLEKFKGAYSPGFDPDIHLTAVGVANQTTMLRGETEEVQRRFRAVMEKKYGVENIADHFRFFDTICGATQDRQDALSRMLKEPMNLLIVVGGYNSSNTSHLAEMGEKVLPTYFIKNAAKMESAALIHHWDQHISQEVDTANWLPEGNITVGITAGASCPNNLIEDTIRRLFELKGASVQELLDM